MISHTGRLFSKEHGLLLILFLAVAVRLFLFSFLSAQNNPDLFYQGDSYGYVQIANNLLSGNGFSMSTVAPYLPDSIRTPLLPVTLAGIIAVFGSPIPFTLVQVVLSLIVIVLTYSIAFLISESRRMALVTAALFAFEPFSVFIDFSILTEVLFTLFLAIGIYTSFKYLSDTSAKNLVLSSIFFALATLTRPIGEFLPFILVLLVLCSVSRRLYLKHILYAVIPFIVVVSPWLIRNYNNFEIVGLSSGGFQNVYSDLGGTIVSLRDHIPWYVAKQNLEQDFAKRHHVDRNTIQQNLSLSPILFREGLLLMIHNPVETAITFGTVSLAFFTNDLWSYYLQLWGILHKYEYGFSPTHSLVTEGPIQTFKKIMETTGPSIVIPLAGRLFWMLSCIFFLIGIVVMVMQGGRKRSFGFLMAGFVLYFLLLSFSNGAGINGRYRYPISPIILTGAVVGAGFIVNSFLKKFLAKPSTALK